MAPAPHAAHSHTLCLPRGQNPGRICLGCQQGCQAPGCSCRTTCPPSTSLFFFFFCQVLCSSSAGTGSLERGFARMARLSSCTAHPSTALSPRLPKGRALPAPCQASAPAHHPPGRCGSCAGRGAGTWSSSCRCLQTRHPMDRRICSALLPRGGTEPAPSGRAGGKASPAAHGVRADTEGLGPGFMLSSLPPG